MIYADPPASALDPSDPLQRKAQTFPKLSDEMVGRIGAQGEQETIPAGTFLYRRGDRAADFFLILDGEVETSEEGPNGEHHIVTTHRAGQFTGETNFLNGRQSLVSNQARRDTRVVRLSRVAF